MAQNKKMYGGGGILQTTKKERREREGRGPPSMTWVKGNMQSRILKGTWNNMKIGGGTHIDSLTKRKKGLPQDWNKVVSGEKESMTWKAGGRWGGLFPYAVHLKWGRDRKIGRGAKPDGGVKRVQMEGG